MNASDVMRALHEPERECEELVAASAGSDLATVVTALQVAARLGALNEATAMTMVQRLAVLSRTAATGGALAVRRTELARLESEAASVAAADPARASLAHAVAALREERTQIENDLHLVRSAIEGIEAQSRTVDTRLQELT